MSIAERIKEIVAYYKLTSAAFANKIGVQPSSVSHILSGRNKPSLDLIQKIINSFTDVNTHWLVTGESNMFTSVNTVKNQSKVTGIDVRSTNEGGENYSANTFDDGNIKPTPTPHNNTKSIDKIVVFYTDKTFDIYKGN